ncbi:hypothetical protein F4779DRAFT_616295 [Xylariaceae sp. FL0662B]|nr:hypothetical protein F4779DRAFT_616295 [Xylariaceae sp. FL0662B]
MTVTSNQAAHNGETPSKPEHQFSRNRPTQHPIDQQSLRSHRLTTYVEGPNSVPLAHGAGPGTRDPQPTHQAKVAAELNSILSRLG